MNTTGNACTAAQRLVAGTLFVLISISAAIATAADDKPMLYFFTSRGCAPCIQVKHVVKQLGSEGYPVTTIDVNQRPDWAKAFRVTHTPTLALVRSNEVLAWQPRPMRAEELRGWFRTIRFTPSPRTAAPKVAQRTSANSKIQTRPAQTKVSLAAHSSNGKHDVNFASPTMHNGTSRPQNEFESDALDATVRLQVIDETGTSFATGTVIHTHGGESLVLTCGHVFRESKGQGEVVAEFGFSSGSPVKVPGKVLDYDSNANDIALVSIRNGSRPLKPVEIASADAIVDRGDRVFTLGCDHGDDPTIRNTAIKNLARYDGSMKYDIFGRPVNGRSGGGIFNAKGQLIGVCNAAAVEVDEGIYTALETVHWQLAKTNLDRLFQSAPTESVVGNTMLAANRTPPRQKLKPSGNLVPIRRAQPAAIASPPAAFASQVRNVSLEEPVRDGSDQEVIITVRSKTNPQDSRTITISDPTPKLLDYLDSMESDEPRALKMAQYRQWR